MKGTYQDGSSHHPQVGILGFEDDKITGFILDPRSNYPREQVDGTFSVTSDTVQITLMKMDSGIEVSYRLGKTNGERAIEGHYTGFWKRFNEKPDSKRDKERKVRMTLDSRL